MGRTSPPRPRPALVRDLADGDTTWNSQHLPGETVTRPCPTPSKGGYAHPAPGPAASHHSAGPMFSQATDQVG